jgi:hypothetical protein
MDAAPMEKIDLKHTEHGVPCMSGVAIKLTRTTSPMVQKELQFVIVGRMTSTRFSLIWESVPKEKLSTGSTHMGIMNQAIADGPHQWSRLIIQERKFTP